MPRLNEDNVVRARQLVALYPHQRSALVPLLHLLQEQDGYVSPDGIEHLAELLDLTPAEVRGTASFYEMFHLKPVGKYLVAVCTNIACMLAGAYELLEHLEQRLGVPAGGTTGDGMFTLEDTECLALCGNAPCLVVNWRYFGDMTPERWDQLADDLAAGRLAGEVPLHGTHIRVQRAVGLEAAGEPRVADDHVALTSSAASADKSPGQRGTPPPPLGPTGQEVELATSRSTPAVASTLAPGAPAGPAEDGSR